MDFGSDGAWLKSRSASEKRWKLRAAPLDRTVNKALFSQVSISAETRHRPALVTGKQQIEVDYLFQGIRSEPPKVTLREPGESNRRAADAAVRAFDDDVRVRAAGFASVGVRLTGVARHVVSAMSEESIVRRDWFGVDAQADLFAIERITGDPVRSLHIFGRQHRRGSV